MIRKLFVLILEKSQEIIANLRQFNLQFELINPRDLFIKVIVASLEFTGTSGVDKIAILNKVIVEKLDSNEKSILQSILSDS